MKTAQLAGIVILIVGIAIVLVGVYLKVSATASTSTNLLGVNSYNVAPGDNQAIGFPISAGNNVVGTFTQTNGTSINFYFMTANQQDGFGNCAPCSSPAIANVSSAKNYNFNWPINSSGTYYLVLDNSNGVSGVGVQLSASSSSGSNGNASTPLIIIAIGVVVVVIGGGIAVIGSRNPKPIAPVPQPESVKKDDRS